MTWTAQILTLHPDAFPGSLGLSLAGRAMTEGLWQLETIQIREFGLGAHRTVDDTPAGGGPGMVMRADVLAAAIDSARSRQLDLPGIYLTPRGMPFNQRMARELVAGRGALLVCGRFEGIDERVIAGRGLMEVSIGDYVLSGGEIAAMVLIDACVRLLPGVMGKVGSGTEESFENVLLEYPHYTRPRTWEGKTIPEVLLSGDHARIEAWRRQQAERITLERRPDLLQNTGGPSSAPADTR
jgi:tRNA (guanine37-N1)-methyltransferase